MVRNSPAYVTATLLRTISLSLWGLALPLLLSVSEYGKYGILATTIVMTAQLGMLGTPQICIANTGQRLPLIGLLSHAAVLSLTFTAIIAVIQTKQIGILRYPFVAAATLATVAYRILGARARARLSFRTNLKAEIASAGILMMGAVIIKLTGYRLLISGPSAMWPVSTEAFACTAASIVLVATQSTRLYPEERKIHGVKHYLPSIYSVGLLTILDVVLWRRVEVFFLERSPDGIQGVAVFTLALQFATLLQTVPIALLDTWQPQLAMLWRINRPDFRNAFRRIEYRYMALIAVVFLVGVPLTAVSVPILFKAYSPWIRLIVLITISRIFFVWGALYSSTMYALAMQRSLYAPIITGGLLAAAANFFLTLPFGLKGSLIAHLTGQVTVSILTWLAFRRALQRSEYFPINIDKHSDSTD